MSVRLVSQEELPGALQGYRLVERLGRGGFGEVWKVEAPGGLMKAAKFVFGDLDALDDDARPAEQELKALRRVREIRHPYILSLERFDTIDGQLIIVMELADRNLWERFRECRGQSLPGIPREELLRFMEETAEALDLMNNHYQIQHLDIKPQNLFLVSNHIKVGDFGLAKLLEGVRATVTGGVTPVYAAPETFEGWVSRFSDQYSLAIVFQELLTGTRPFNGANTRQLLMQHVSSAPDLSSLPEADQPVIGRALNKHPDDRWPTCTELVQALRRNGAPAAPALAGLPRNAAPRPETQTPAATQQPRSFLGVDSVQATRVAPGNGDAPPELLARARGETPQPIVLPPLVKPAGFPPTPDSTPTPSSGFGPRLVTPAAAAHNPAMTLQRQAIFQTGRMGSLGIAPPERSGDGELFPALVVALGQTGRRAAEQFKQLVAENFGHTDRVPNIRFLFIDTDPSAVPARPDEAGVAQRESVLARLNRPGHYLQRDSLPPIDAWMPPGTLYKLARNPDSAGGVRAFGRLALFDNYRLVAQRVRQEIETFLTDAPLAEAAKNTKLGLRTNRPRAYVLAGLGGGTGSGMFLDVAYLLRHELRQVGYLRPEVVGLFFVPPANKDATRNTALGNTFAALAELHQFQQRLSIYKTAFDRAEAPIVDTDAPFARVAVLPLPKGPEPRQQLAAARLAARALYNETLTPAGRVADETREATAVPPAGPTCQTFGLFRLSWPRPEMLSAATRRFAQRQIQRWTGKEAAHLRTPIAEWLARQWFDRKLDLESVVGELRAAAHASLGDEPERVFDAIVEPLHTRTPSGARIDAAGVCSVFDQLLKVVGKPDAETQTTFGSVSAVLAARQEQLLKEAEGHVAVMAATFLEVPQFRLPGAEETVRQIGDRLKQQVDTLEPLRHDLDREVQTLYGRVLQAIGTLSATTGFGAVVGRKASVMNDIQESLQAYPRKRLQLHIAELCLSLYRRVLGNLPEYLREINFCRGSLAEMHALLAAPDAAPNSTLVTAGKLILPDGCHDLDAAADQFLAGLPPEELLAFEQALQKEVGRKLRGLGSVCLKAQQKGARFRAMLLNMAREFLDKKLDNADQAAVFFRCRPHDASAEPLIVEAFGSAAPTIDLGRRDTRPREVAILGVPAGESGDRFRELAARVLPDAELIPATLPDDICFYREYPQLLLTELPQLGEYAREAYQYLATGEHPPHSRTDVPWQPPGP
jgi:serine/threonine protein kinase